MSPLRAAIALTTTLIASKLLILFEHGGPKSVAGGFVFFWQDTVTGLGLGALVWTIHRWGSRVQNRNESSESALLPSRLVRGASLVLYAGLVLHAVVNTAIALATGSPTTAAMWGAAGSALEDSIRKYWTTEILLPTGFVGVLGILLAVLPVRLSSRSIPLGPRRIIATGFLVMASGVTTIGYCYESKVDTFGLHRSGTVTLIRSFLPRVPARHLELTPPDEPTHERSAAHWFTEDGLYSNSLSTSDPSELAWAASRGPSPAFFDAARGGARGRHLLVVVLESASHTQLARTAWLARTAQTRSAPAGEDAFRHAMPFLESLQSRSWSAPHAYTVYPESIRGFWPLLAGRYPAFETAAKEYRTRKPSTIATELRAAGYSTALYHAGRFDYLGMRHIIEERGFDRCIDAAEVSGIRDSSFGVDESSVVSRLLEDLEDRAHRPTFTMYLPIAGHHPYPSNGGPFEGEGDRSDYLNALLEADRALEQLFTGLRERGILKDSVVAIVGDHGQAFGEHPGNFGHVFFLYEENLRIPLLIHAPGITDVHPTAPLEENPVSVIDLVPTLLDLLDLGDSFGQGKSWLRAPALRPVFFFTDYSLPLVGVRVGPWKLIHDLDSDRSELYHLERDPTEQHNCARDEPERTEFLRARALEWIHAQAGPG